MAYTFIIYRTITTTVEYIPGPPGTPRGAPQGQDGHQRNRAGHTRGQHGQHHRLHRGHHPGYKDGTDAERRRDCDVREREAPHARNDVSDEEHGERYESSVLIARVCSH